MIWLIDCGVLRVVFLGCGMVYRLGTGLLTSGIASSACCGDAWREFLPDVGGDGSGLFYH